MENKNITRKKVFLFLTLSIFTFIFLNCINVSATAFFNPVPPVSLSIYQETVVNLNQFCYSDIAFTQCAPSSYSVQFTDPDTGSTVTLYSFSSTSSNSYFTASLGSNGNLNLMSKGKSLDRIGIVVRGSDVPLTSGVNTVGFYFSISNYNPPIQDNPLQPISLAGNYTYFLDLTKIFSNFNSISIAYSDPISAQSQYFRVGFGQSQCSQVGAIQACLNGTIGGQMYLYINSQNLASNISMYLTAFNQFGQTPANSPLYITTQPQVQSYTSPPNLTGAQFPNIIIGYDNIGYVSLYDFIQNYTFINATITMNTQPGGNHKDIYLQIGQINNTLYTNSVYQDENISFSLITDAFQQVGQTIFAAVVNSFFPGSFTVNPGYALLINSKETYTEAIITFRACNNAGCVGNFSNFIFLGIQQNPPAIDKTFAQANSFKIIKNNIVYNYDLLKYLAQSYTSSQQSQWYITSTTVTGINPDSPYDPSRIRNSTLTNLSVTHEDPINTNTNYRVLNSTNISSSLFDLGSVIFPNEYSTSLYHYVASFTINSGNITINGGPYNNFNLTPGTYNNYNVLSNSGSDLNFTSNGNAIINSIDIYFDQVNETLSSIFIPLTQGVGNGSYVSEGTFSFTLTNSTLSRNFIGSPSDFPYYSLRLYPSGMLQLTSGSSEKNVTLAFSFCNLGGCTSTVSANPQAVPGGINYTAVPILSEVHISTSSYNNLGSSSQTVNNVVGSFLGIFPQAEQLTDKQKTIYVILTMFILNFLLFIIMFLVSGEVQPGPILTILGVVDFLLFLLFLYLRYIPTVVILVAAFVAIGYILIKLVFGRR